MNEKDKKSLKQELEASQIKVKELEDKLNEYNQLRMTIFNNLIHELRTPLNGILGFSEMMNSSDLSIDEHMSYAGSVNESAGALMTLLNDVVDIARLEANHFKMYPVAFDLNDLIFDIYIEFKEKAEKQGLQLFLENLISEPFVIDSDPDVLKRVLCKLLENAIKFTKTGWLKLFHENKGDEIIFTIEDTGIGIDKSLRSNLFNRFIAQDVSKSRNTGGTGADLSLCNGLVRVLGGEIWYEAKKDGGSIFRFSIKNID